MSAVAAPPLTVVLIGNPNTGKSTLFNALSGFRALTGNFPGVTVEKKIGRTKCGDRLFDFFDLPGTYSLSPPTLAYMVAVNGFPAGASLAGDTAGVSFYVVASY